MTTPPPPTIRCAHTHKSFCTFCSDAKGLPPCIQELCDTLCPYHLPNQQMHTRMHPIKPQVKSAHDSHWPTSHVHL